ncbi:hypothetical protein BDV36DRAFT_242922, partial [Aspergillus pseudocaelatus]
MELDPLYHYLSSSWGHHVGTSCFEDSHLVVKFVEMEKHVSACGRALVVTRDYRGPLAGPLPEELTGIRLTAYLDL